MAYISSIRSTAIQTCRVALLLWPRLLALILFSLIIDQLFHFVSSHFFPQGTPNASRYFNLLFFTLISPFGTLALWSWLLSGWIRHELATDGTPHPLSAGEHFRAPCWHQFCAISVSGSYFLIMTIPYIIFLSVTGFIRAYSFNALEEVELHITIYFVILFFAPYFCVTIFYLRYNVGIISITLYGKTMSLRTAYKYSKKHESTGLTRRIAASATMIVLFLFLFISMTETGYEPSVINARSLFYNVTLSIMTTNLLFIIGMMALISGYLKNIPAEALEPQPEQSG